jgi:hypothetical protein
VPLQCFIRIRRHFRDQTAGFSNDWNQFRPDPKLGEFDLATVAFWRPASTEFGEPVPEKFSLLRRFSLAREGKSVVSRLKLSRHVSHFRADEPENRASNLPFEVPERRFPPLLSPQPLFSRSPNRTLAPHAHQP